MSRVVIVPGLHDSGAQHWQTLWQQQLPDALRVQQQHWDVPDLARWSDNVAAVLQQLDSEDECWIVAHSFGCLASVHAIAQLSAAASLVNIRGLFLVAPADPRKFSVVEQLPAGPLPLPGYLIASRSDPWLSWTSAQQWAQRWQLTLFDAGDAGHINADSGHGLWRQGWHLFQQFTLRSAVQQLKDNSEFSQWHSTKQPHWALAI